MCGSGKFFSFFLKDVYTLAADEIDLEEGGETVDTEERANYCTSGFLGT